MSLPGQSSHQVRFGDFELDLRTGELCRKGRKFTLQGQPFQVLSILLKRPGQLVTREELKATLWPADTFVNFDHSLNKAVNRLREALMDVAERPRFIETLPRRGYRWIGPVCQQVSIPLEKAVPDQMPAAADDRSKVGHSRFVPDGLLEIRHRVGQISITAFLALGVIDGNPDLIVANQYDQFWPDWGESRGRVSVLLGRGDGTFQPAVLYYSGGQSAQSVAIGDVNGDGKPDLIVLNQYWDVSNGQGLMLLFGFLRIVVTFDSTEPSKSQFLLSSRVD